ncbi:MAG TPA: tRNA preQ1(34) S-adenosylmethionine ribosyltransferase-isomerase QueA [Acidimicrobiia bacterium]|nr:tRNA preQ1(34) S-adenosylmethionine ribosyltransferase-isomerase QueA [Acidimicrobiia bacterium]
MDLARFRYELPDDAIAQEPMEPRDAARLLDARDLSDHHFRDLPDLLLPGDLVVMNTTRVRRARLLGHRAGTGGAVELLLLHRNPDGGWSALVSPARRIRAGVELVFGPLQAVVTDDPVDGVLAVTFADESLLEEVGTVPLPPYIRTELSDPERYQTVYAETPGSAAAPTAGLHFTEGVLRALDARGVERATVELRVGLGTFRPITVDRIEDHEMHREWCAVPEATARAISEARRRGGRVVAVGTTTVRTLETFARPDGTVGHGETETDLFLRPGSTFHVVNLLVTNFHVPGSSLLVMLAAFMGDGWVEAYRVALERRYRFLSFGDAMLCER